jgi:hypothetical protein
MAEILALNALAWLRVFLAYEIVFLWNCYNAEVSKYMIMLYACFQVDRKPWISLPHPLKVDLSERVSQQ